MFRTHTLKKLHETGNRWFIVNSFNDSVIPPRHNLQSINRNSELKISKNAENRKRDGARRVSDGRESFVSKFKSAAKLNNSGNSSNKSNQRIVSIPAEKAEVLNNRYDLKELQKEQKSLIFGYYQ